MTEHVYHKQIAYPSFYTRLMAAGIDVLIAAIFIMPILSYFTINYVYDGVLPQEILKDALSTAPSDDKMSLSEIINYIGSNQAMKDFFANQGFQKIMLDQFLQITTFSVFVIFFWFKYRATPGKLLFSLKIVDSETMQNASKWQLLKRYFGYFLSALPLFFGFFAISFNKQGRGWHDKFAGTVVIKK